MTVSQPRRSIWRNLSVVWLVPIIALAVSLGIAWQNFADRGTLIEISFSNASGVVAGETTLRYRDVVVGTVEDVRFSDDLGRVLVDVRVENEVAGFIDDEAMFWVVRPEVSARGISGLSTVLSGVYIEGAWDNAPGVLAQQFLGSETPPLNQPGRPGRRITLATDDGTTISYGSPVLFRGVEVGRMETPRLSADGRTVLVDAFIDAPHDARLNQATRFWDTSGFELSFGASGFSVDFDSLASLVTGGVSFDNVYENGEPLPPGYVFTLFEDESAARRNTLVRGPAQGVPFTIQFTESVEGLGPGDDVTYQGLEVGVVTDLRSRVVETQLGPEVSLLAQISIDPQRMGLPTDATPADTVDFFRFAVESGLRARLATESLLSSDLKIELVVMDSAPSARLREIDGEPPRLPSVESNLSDFTATAEGVLERINALPVEEVMQQAISLMQAFEELARNEDLQRVPGSAVALLDDTRALVGSEAIQAIPAQIEAAVTDLTDLVADLREGGAIAALNSAMRNLDRAMADVSIASQNAPALTENLRKLTESDIPALIAEFEAVATTAKELELQGLVDSATSTLNRVDALVGSQDTLELPGTLNDALTEMRLALAELREGGVVENLNATLQSASDAAGSVAESVEDLPQLTARLERLVAETETVVRSYGDRSDFNTQTLAALREVQNAAKAISELARAIERSPNSLIFGR
jgi:paraquat-inducible protein B